MRKPWFRKQNSCWYCEDASGKQTNLGADKDAAFDLWHKLSSGAADLVGPGLSLAHLVDEFLSHVEAEKAATTFDWYKIHLIRVCESLGATPVADLRPIHLTAWLNKIKAKRGTRRATIRCVKAALNWAVDAGSIESHRLTRMKASKSGRRELTIDEATHRKALAGVHKRVRLVLSILWHTGMRPEEVREFSAKHWRPATGQLVFPNAKGDRPRVVRLGPCMQTLARILTHFRPDGPVLVSQRGRKPWTVNSIRCQFRSMRAKGLIPAGATAYSYRHTYITDALEKGFSTSAVAELAGHNDATMIAKHYGHLEQRGGMLDAAAIAVRSTPPMSLDRTQHAADESPRPVEPKEKPSGDAASRPGKSASVPPVAPRKTKRKTPRPPGESESPSDRT